MITLSICYFGIEVNKKSKQKLSTEKTVARIPDFSQKTNLLKLNTPSVFIAFHPECEHCQYEAKGINNKQEVLKNTNIVLFTSANDSLTSIFSHKYGLDSLKNVHVLSDKTNEMYHQFGIKIIPTILIYNAEANLLKQYKGETKIDAILKTLALSSN
jgi:peroxiredoxin